MRSEKKEIRVYVDDIGGHFRFRVFYGKEGARALAGNIILRKEEVADFFEELHGMLTTGAIENIIREGGIKSEVYKVLKARLRDICKKGGSDDL